MRVAVVAASDGPGGAGRSARELHRAFRLHGMESKMFVHQRTTETLNVHQFPARLGRLRAKVEFEAVKALTPQRKAWFSANIVPDLKWARVRSYRPDVVSLHWINAGQIGIESLPLLPRPIVWTLHDMWPLTGGCHNDGGCGRYRDKCGSCPILDSSSALDLSSVVLSRKKLAWRRTDPTLVVASNWMDAAARQNAVFADAPVFKIPRPIDTDVFAPLDEAEARASFGLPQGSFILACGAHSLTSDPNKGWQVLADAISRLPPQDNDTLLLVFGTDESLPSTLGSVRVRQVGAIQKASTLAQLYNAANLVVMPSHQESFGRVAAEAFACGTPVVAFKSPGAGEIVDEEITGFIATEFSPHALLRVIEGALDRVDDLRAMGGPCRQQALQTFSPAVIAAQYANVFEQAQEREAGKNARD